jgi:hypothetical protein
MFPMHARVSLASAVPFLSCPTPSLCPALSPERPPPERSIHSFGWKSVDQYYAGSSSSLSVPRLAVPTLCLQVLMKKE